MQKIISIIDGFQSALDVMDVGENFLALLATVKERANLLQREFNPETNTMKPSQIYREYLETREMLNELIAMSKNGEM